MRWRAVDRGILGKTGVTYHVRRARHAEKSKEEGSGDVFQGQQPLTSWACVIQGSVTQEVNKGRKKKQERKEQRRQAMNEGWTRKEMKKKKETRHVKGNHSEGLQLSISPFFSIGRTASPPLHVHPYYLLSCTLAPI